MEKELVVVIDFGGQYNQLVARRVRECNVYCEIYSYKTDLNKIKAMNPKGIILTGGPASCYEPGAATCSEDLFNLGVPVLGLCYGAQLMTHVLGGKVERAAVREYGKTEVKVDRSSKLFSDVSETDFDFFYVGSKECKTREGCGTDCETLTCCRSGVSKSVKHIRTLTDFRIEFTHLSVTSRVVGNRAVSVGGKGYAKSRKHSDCCDTDAVETEAEALGRERKVKTVGAEV